MGEIHCHSIVSDGIMTPEVILRLAARLGFRVLSITDHDTFRGSALALRASRVMGFRDLIIACGSEVRTSWGDVLVICPQCPPGEAPRDPLELRDFADSNGCAVIAAHPYHFGRKSVASKIRREPGVFDAIEVWNPRGFPLLNVPAILYARKSGKPATSGSDAHVPSELGVAPIVFMEEPRDGGEAVDMIKKGLVAPTIALPPPKSFIEALAWAITRRATTPSAGQGV